MIFKNVNSLVAAAFDADAGTAHFGETVDVERLNAGLFFNTLSHLFGPRFGTENTHANRKIMQIDSHLSRLFAKVNKIGRRAADTGYTEVAHQHDLALRVASGCGNNGRAERFHTVVRTESTCEQTVAVGVLNDVAAVDSRHGERTFHAAHPDVDIVFGIADNNRFPSGSAGSVETHNLLHVKREKTERIGVAQIFFHHERELGNIGERVDIGRLDAFFIHAFAIELHVVVFMRDNALKTLELNLFEQRTRDIILRADRIVMSGKHRGPPFTLQTPHLCGTPPG